MQKRIKNKRYSAIVIALRAMAPDLGPQTVAKLARAAIEHEIAHVNGRGHVIFAPVAHV